jgi:quinol monooxygenase YgiN
MSYTAGPIYEVTFNVDREIVAAFDAWLAIHVTEMLEVPGFLKAETFQLEDDEQGRSRRVTHYYLASEEDLEQYLAGPANAMRQSVIDQFADQFEASRRILRRLGDSDEELRPLPSCLNCGTTLGGQYCPKCGQRAHSRLISVWELIRDAFGDLFELDSRLWQTLLPLVIRPGRLTQDYLLGRRARFMPPFRTYLVLSVVFFLVAFFDPREELGLLFEPEAESTEQAEESDQNAAEIREGVLQELAEQGITVGDKELLEDPQVDDTGNSVAVDITDGESDSGCDVSDIESADIPQWLSRRITPERLQLVCERIRADDGRALLDKLLDNVPVALFILLPLMALVLRVLYPLSKRYYVEHLLFVVHYHAFFFLILTLQILFARFATLVSIPENATDIALFGASLYIPVYLFRAMQRVYGQGRFITTLKFIFLVLSYFLGFGLMFAFAGLFAAFSI